MEHLTSEQVNQLAGHFLSMAQSIEEFRSQNFTNLSPAQNKDIKDFHTIILDCADNLYTLSATLVLEDVAASLAKIGEVTNRMKTLVTTLKNVQKAIDIAASVVTLSKSILAGNLPAIGTSLAGLDQAVRS